MKKMTNLMIHSLIATRKWMMKIKLQTNYISLSSRFTIYCQAKNKRDFAQNTKTPVQKLQ